MIPTSRHPRRGLPAVLAVALLAMAGCYSMEEEQPPAGSDERTPDQVFYNYRLIESEAGVKRWVLDSDKMEKYADQEDVELYGVRMQFYRDGVFHSTLTSERGLANLTRRDLFAWGDVVVQTEDGRRLETEELHYDNRQERIHNDVFNRFLRGNEWMTGFGLEATPDLDYIEIKQRVRAEVTDEGAAEDDAR